MSEKLQFAADIERFLAMFPGLKAYADQVGKVGSLEQSASEAETRVAKAKKDFDDQAAKFQAIHADHLAKVEDAKQKIADASGDTARILTAAHEQAAKIVAEAEAKGAALAAAAVNAADAANDTLEGLHKQIADARAEIEQVRAEQSDETDALNKIAARKKQFQESLSELKARL